MDDVRERVPVGDVLRVLGAVHDAVPQLDLAARAPWQPAHQPQRERRRDDDRRRAGPSGERSATWSRVRDHSRSAAPPILNRINRMRPAGRQRRASRAGACAGTSLPVSASKRSDTVADSRPRDVRTSSVHRPIRNQAAPRPGRHGGDLPRPRSGHRSARRPEAAAQRRRQRRHPQPLRPGSPRLGRAHPPQYRHHPRLRRVRRLSVHRDGVHPRRDAGGDRSGAAPRFRSRRSCAGSSRSATRSATRTARTSCIATSSRPT